jgi:hemolysin activation/secretion protein
MGADYKFDEVATLATNFFYTTSKITNSQGVVIRKDVVPVVGNSFPSSHYAPFFFGWNGSRPDKWGQFNGSVSAILGMGGVFSRLNEFPAEIAQSKQATTEFAVLRPQLSRSQKLVQGFTLYGNVTGQWANEPVLNLEQLAVGGVSSVRGYHEGERYADTGLTMQGELRSPTFGLGEGKPIGVQLIGFTDYGEGYLLDPAAGQKASQALWGAGAGLNFSFGPRVESHISIAWPLMDSAFTRAGRERVLFSVSAQL